MSAVNVAQLRTIVAERGACGTAIAVEHVDPELWFAESLENNPIAHADTQERRARAATYCAACPIALECFTVAVEAGEFGVWGGHWFPAGSHEPQRLPTTPELQVWRERHASNVAAVAGRSSAHRPQAGGVCEDKVGTEAGYSRHMRAKELSCVECLAEHNAVTRDRKARRQAARAAQ